MYLQARIKCERDGTPYRVYINDELITERFFSIPPSVLNTIKYQEDGEKYYFQTSDVSNILALEIEDCEKYDIKIENLSDVQVHLHELTTQETPFENK